MTHTSSATATMTNPSNNTGKNRRLSFIRLFNGKTKASEGVESVNASEVPPVPTLPVHYRHSMASSMNTLQTEMMRQRRKSIAAMADGTGRSVSLDLKHSTEMTDKMRQFDELLQKRRSSTIRISLTPSLLQDS
ncbi:hypothetical protein BX616_000401 [Lobosporangium transversale]|nr:hypothetical protein BX616_000401 [Lobosporangium transversale]